MSSRILLESFLVSSAAGCAPRMFSASSLGEYSAYSFAGNFSSTGAYSCLRELSLAALVRLLLSLLVRLFSMLVRRLSVGDEGG